MSTARLTGFTFKGLNILLEGATEEEIMAFRRFSRGLAEEIPVEDIQPEEETLIDDPIPLGRLPHEEK